MPDPEVPRTTGLVVRLTQVPEDLVIPGREVRNILVQVVPLIQDQEGLDTVARVGRDLMAQEARHTKDLVDPVMRAPEVLVTLAQAVAIRVLRYANSLCVASKLNMLFH